MSLKKNIVGLALAQIFSYIVPLLQLPYLSRTVGSDIFGLLVYTLSLTQLAMIFTDFGFDLSLTKLIAEGKRKKRILGTFLYQSVIIKTGVIVLSCIFITIFAFLSGHFNNNFTYLFWMIVTIVFNGYNQRWLFQGLEKSYIYSWVVILTRIISLVAIFVLIKKPADYVWFPAILAFQALLLTLGCGVIIRRWGIKIQRVRFSGVIVQFKLSLEYFLSRVGVAVYSTGCGVFLGTFGKDLHQVAIYGVAEQLYKAGSQVYYPIMTALTPYMMRTKNYVMLRKVSILISITLILGTSTGWLFGDYIIQMMFGSKFLAAKPILDIFMFTIIGSVLGMLFGYPALMPLNKGRHANISVLFSGGIQVVVLLLLYFGVYPITALSVSISYLVCDWIMFAYRGTIFALSYKKEVGNVR